MTIGEELKFCRLRAGKTQTEWIGDLMSGSFYSKVERGIHSIDADLLLQLLAKNHLSVEMFFSLIDTKKTTDPDYQLKTRMRIAQNAKDLAELDRIKEEIKAKHDGKIEPYRTKRELEFTYAWVTHSNKYVSQETIDKTIELLNHEEWDFGSYITLADAIVIMDLKQASSLVHFALQDFNKKFRSVEEYASVNVLICNYLNYLYHQQADWKYYQEPIEFIRKSPNDPSLTASKILAAYYEALYKNDPKTADEVVSVFKKGGIYPWIEDTVEEK